MQGEFINCISKCKWISRLNMGPIPENIKSVI